MEFGNFDLSRIPPRIFLAGKDGRAAVRNEFRALMKKDVNEIPIGHLVDYTDARYRLIPKIHTTTVCKIKPNHGYKIRLCLRGDLQEESKVQFASAPTVGGDFLKLFLSIYSMHVNWGFCTVDITKAFTQGDYVRKSDRCIAILPPYFFSESENWNGWISTGHSSVEVERDFVSDSSPCKTEVKLLNDFSSSSKKWGLLLFRPLYGSRDAPLRWWLPIAACLGKWGFAMLRSD